MQQLILILHILIAIAIIALVLVQHGKGADMGAGFGGGASNTMFGSQGSTPFLVKLTGGLALLFFVTSSVMSFLVSKEAKPDDVLSATHAPMKTIQPIPIAADNATENTAAQKPVAVVAPATSTKPTGTTQSIQQTTSTQTHKNQQGKTTTH